MKKEPWYGDGKILACEKDFSSHDQALIFKEEDALYLVSGRVDRIDQLGDAYLVTDYKLAKSDALKVEIRNITTNMQMPIYLRLVAKNVSKSQNTYFAYASIRDGNIVFLSPEKNAKSYEAIYDDNNEQSLPKILHSIFSPITAGKILATPGDHCLACDFSYICRRKEMESHV
jgi:ATP-dependent helicase/DNAse subunit B